MSLSSGTVAAPLPPLPPPFASAATSGATLVASLVAPLVLPTPMATTIARKAPRKTAVVPMPPVPVPAVAAIATSATATQPNAWAPKKASRAAPKKSARSAKPTSLLAPPPPPPPPPPSPPPSSASPIATVIVAVVARGGDATEDVSEDADMEKESEDADGKAPAAAVPPTRKKAASKKGEKKATATGGGGGGGAIAARKSRAAVAAAPAAEASRNGDDEKRGSDATAQAATDVKDDATEEEDGEEEEEDTFDLSDSRVASLWQAANSLATRSEAALLYVAELMCPPPATVAAPSSGKRPSSRKKSGDAASAAAAADGNMVGVGDPSLGAALLGMTDLSAELRKSHLDQTTAIARAMRRKAKKDEAAADTNTGVALLVSASVPPPPPPPPSSSTSSAVPSPQSASVSSSALPSSAAAAAAPSSSSSAATTVPNISTQALVPPPSSSSSTAPAPLAPSSLSLTFQPPPPPSSASQKRRGKKGAADGKRATARTKPLASSKKAATASVTSTRVLRSKREIAREARLVEQREAVGHLAHVTHRETLEFNVAPCFGCRVCLHPEMRASGALAVAPWCIFPPFFTVVARRHPWRGASVNAVSGSARLTVAPDPAVRASTAPKLAPVPLDGLARRVPGRHSYAQLVKLLTKPAKSTKPSKTKKSRKSSSSSSSSSDPDVAAAATAGVPSLGKKSSSKSRAKSEADASSGGGGVGVAEKPDRETKKASSKKSKESDASKEKRRRKSAKSKVGVETKAEGKRSKKKKGTVEDDGGDGDGSGDGDDDEAPSTSAGTTGDSDDGETGGGGAKKPKARVSVLQTLMALAAAEPVTVHDVEDEEDDDEKGGAAGTKKKDDAAAYQYPYYIRKGVNRGLPVAVVGSTLRFEAVGFYGVTPATDSADENKTASESDDGLIFSWRERLEARGVAVARPPPIDVPDPVRSLGNWKRCAPIGDRALGGEVQRLLSAAGIATSLEEDDDDDDSAAKNLVSRKRTRSPAARGGGGGSAVNMDASAGGATDGKAARKKPKTAALAKTVSVGETESGDGKEEKRDDGDSDDGADERKKTQEAMLDLKLKTVADVVRQYVNDPTRGLEYTRAPEPTLAFLEFEDKAQQPKGWVALGRAAIDVIVRHWPPLAPVQYAANGVTYVAQAIQSGDPIAFALPGADPATYRVFQYNLQSGLARQIRRVDAPPSTTVSTSLERDGLGPLAHVLALPPVAQRRPYESFRNLRPVESVSLLQMFADAHRYESSVLGVALAPSVYSLAPVVSSTTPASSSLSSAPSSSSTSTSTPPPPPPPPPTSVSPPGGPALVPIPPLSTFLSLMATPTATTATTPIRTAASATATLAGPVKTAAAAAASSTTSVADRLRRRALQNLENIDIGERKTWIAALLGGGGGSSSGDGGSAVTPTSASTSVLATATTKSTGSSSSSSFLSRSSPASSPRALKGDRTSTNTATSTTTTASTAAPLPAPTTSLAVMMRASEMLPQRRRIDVDSPNLLYAALARFVTHAFVSGLGVVIGGSSRPWATHAVVVERIEALIDAASEMRYRRQVATTRAAHDDRKLPWQIDERLAFHGTPFASADAIVRGGFRGMYNSQSSYGFGTYFSTDASYSDEYAKPCPSTGRQTMFVARLLVNGAKPTSHGDLMPGWHVNRHAGGGGSVGAGAWLRAVPERGLGDFPCVVGCDQWPDSKILVMAENDSILPLWLITYRRVPR